MLLGGSLFAHADPLRSRSDTASEGWESLVSIRRRSREQFANNRFALLCVFKFSLWFKLCKLVVFHCVPHSMFGWKDILVRTASEIAALLVAISQATMPPLGILIDGSRQRAGNR